MTERRENSIFFDAVLFDLDGTLIDTVPMITHCFQEVFARLWIATRNRRHCGGLSTHVGRFGDIATGLHQVTLKPGSVHGPS